MYYREQLLCIKYMRIVVYVLFGTGTNKVTPNKLREEKKQVISRRTTAHILKCYHSSTYMHTECQQGTAKNLVGLCAATHSGGNALCNNAHFAQRNNDAD